MFCNFGYYGLGVQFGTNRKGNRKRQSWIFKCVTVAVAVAVAIVVAVVVAVATASAANKL